MNKIRVSLSLLSAAIAIPGLAAAADISNAKLLSGPPSEFASMAPAKAESSLQTSKSAMIPITLRDDGRGNLSWEGSIAVEAEQLRMALLNGGGKFGDTAFSLHQLHQRECQSFYRVPGQAFNCQTQICAK